MKKSHWFTTCAAFALGMFIMATIGLRIAGNLSSEVSDLRMKLSQAQAAVGINTQHEAILASVIAKGKGTLTETQIIEVTRTIHEQFLLYRQDGLTPSLILAMIERESHFNSTARSNKNAFGLMQIRRATAIPYLRKRGLSWSEQIMFNPRTNIQIGTQYLVDLHRMYMDMGLEEEEDFKLSTHSYFWGPTNTSLLLASKGERVPIPSLEYSVGVIDLQSQYNERGVF